ncbi:MULTISPECIES: aspartyl protease family protein [Henriciella]|uniref:aspartyl protease family protein n=1 Tax=Henriciella TaxID=453849 RepID=UPI0035148FFE
MFRFTIVSVTLLLALHSLPCAVAQQADLRAVFSAPVGIERASPVASLPVQIEAGKLKLDAAVNAKPGRFVFDTGSPTILSSTFAADLGLEIVGQNTGKDANGVPVSMDVAVVDTMTLGDTTFRNVPVLIFDFAGLPLADCFIGDGVIGSEIFPGSAWRINTETGEIQIAASVSDLGLSEEISGAPLYDFGYPHAPIIDYSIGAMHDKALFDTGSGKVFSLFAKAMQSPEVKAATVSGSVRKGSGSEGVSAGGQGAVTDLVTLQLQSLQIAGVSLQDVPAQSRLAPPSLLGAGVLSSHIVTLDYPGKRLLLEPRSAPVTTQSSGNYAIMYGDEGAEVTQLYEKSEADRAGLRLGDRVTYVNGRALSVPDDEQQCATARWLVDEFDATQPATLVIDRQGREIFIELTGATD